MKDIPNIRCPVCGADLNVKVSTSRRKKVSLSLACPTNGRHFRAFINDSNFVRRVMDSLEGDTPSSDDRNDVIDKLAGSTLSISILEGPNS